MISRCEALCHCAYDLADASTVRAPGGCRSGQSAPPRASPRAHGTGQSRCASCTAARPQPRCPQTATAARAAPPRQPTRPRAGPPPSRACGRWRTRGTALPGAPAATCPSRGRGTIIVACQNEVTHQCARHWHMRVLLAVPAGPLVAPRPSRASGRRADAAYSALGRACQAPVVTSPVTTACHITAFKPVRCLLDAHTSRRDAPACPTNNTLLEHGCTCKASTSGGGASCSAACTSGLRARQAACPQLQSLREQLHCGPAQTQPAVHQQSAGCQRPSLEPASSQTCMNRHFYHVAGVPKTRNFVVLCPCLSTFM